MSRLDLKKIYGFDTFRCVKRPISGDQGSSTSTGSHKSPEKCASVLDTNSQQVRITHSHEADETLDDFTPYDIPIPNYPNLARTVLNEKSNTI
ncbi:unnamed protein product, partial [Allacma fusca]